MNAVYSETNYANTNIMPSLVSLDKLRYKFNTLRIRVANHTLTSDAAKVAEIDEAIKKLQSEIADTFSEHEAYISGNDERKLLEMAKVDVDKYFTNMEPILVASRANDKVNAQALYIGIRATAEKANSSIADHIEFKIKQSKLNAATAEAAKRFG